MLPIIREACEIIRPVIENKQQHINLILPSTLNLVTVDVEMTRRVVVNLLENASKYSPPGSMIQAGSKDEANNVRVWVQDDGPGIPATEKIGFLINYTTPASRPDHERQD
jgi:two-component system sensor histidine kinase KdpD